MITLDDYLMGRDKEYPKEYTGEIIYNAKDTVERVNKLLELFGHPRAVTSGWRPTTINSAVKNASLKSKHIAAEACDLEDKDGLLDTFCMNNLNAMSKIGLWLEHPSSTPGWCHIQTIAPKSGNRVFFP